MKLVLCMGTVLFHTSRSSQKWEFGSGVTLSIVHPHHAPGKKQNIKVALYRWWISGAAEAILEL